MKRIIIHWTAGTYAISDIDRAHYHFIVDGNGDVQRGVHVPEDNHNTRDGKYAAHTRGCNSGSIGLSAACMFGATEKDYGKFPLKELQWKRMALQAATLADRYRIPVTRQTILSHAEVQPTLGIKQRGKWDIAVLPWDPSVKGAVKCGDVFRALVKSHS